MRERRGSEMKLKRLIQGLILAAMLQACSTTSHSYVVDSSDYSVVRGEIVDVQNLTAQEFRHLSDGVAIVLSGSGGRVTIRFDADQEKTFEVGDGAVVVFGDGSDYLLRNELR